MQAKKKTGIETPGERNADPASALSGVSAAEGASASMQAPSPARALQIRLARELIAPPRPWLWNATSLVLTLILALSLAGTMLDFGL